VGQRVTWEWGVGTDASSELVEQEKVALGGKDSKLLSKAKRG